MMGRRVAAGVPIEANVTVEIVVNERRPRSKSARSLGDTSGLSQKSTVCNSMVYAVASWWDILGTCPARPSLPIAALSASH